MSTNALTGHIAGAVVALLVACASSASAATPAAAVPASAALPTGAALQPATDPASGPTPGSSGPASGIAPIYLQQAPTLRALSELATRERMKQANERYSKLLESQQLTQPNKEPVKLDVKPTGMTFEPIPVIRKVLAIFGPMGKEKAEIERGDGVVVAVEQGAVVDGFRVLSIRPGTVDVQQVRADCPGKAGAAAGKRVAQGSSRRNHAKVCGAAPVQRISVGGIFKS